MGLMHALARLASLALVPLALGCGSSSSPAATATTTASHAGGASTTASSGGAGGASTTTSKGGAGGASTTTTAGADASVTAFDKAHVYFTGDDNERQLDADVSFPESGDYESITLHLALDCPSGGCDAWDRFGTLGVVTKKGQDGGPDAVVEVARFITPYKVKAGWDLDVTDLRPLLRGDVTMRVFIDTWVGSGSPYGAGWAVTAKLDFKGGAPKKRPVAVVPVFAPTYVPYGDPDKPIATTLPASSVDLPKASSYALRAFVTGHGQGNLQNCAEFCAKTHTLAVGAAKHDKKVWRTDCAKTAAPNQQGTYQYSRAGWCPGADVKPWVVDVTADVGGASASFGYDVEAFENTCRPGQSPCKGCSLGATCDYDGGAHTEPNYEVSALLIAYE